MLSLVDRTCLYHVGMRCHVSLFLILAFQYGWYNPNFHPFLFLFCARILFKSQRDEIVSLSRRCFIHDVFRFRVKSKNIQILSRSDP